MKSLRANKALSAEVRKHSRFACLRQLSRRLLGSAALVALSVPASAQSINTVPQWEGTAFAVFGAQSSENLALSSSGVEVRLANGALMVKGDSEWDDHSRTDSGTGPIRY
jgi:hypothetical protein